MGANAAGQILASKWDAGYAVLMFVRALLGGLPAWAKWIIGGLVAVVLVLEGRRWWRRRGTAVR